MHNDDHRNCNNDLDSIYVKRDHEADKRLDAIAEYGDFFYNCIQEMQLFNKSIGLENQKNIMIKNILAYVKHEQFFSQCEFDENGIQNANFYIRYDEIDNYIHSYILNRKKEKQ